MTITWPTTGIPTISAARGDMRRAFEVLGTRGRVARRVVVAEHDGACTCCERGAQHHPVVDRSDQLLSADGGDVCTDDAVPAVQEDEREVLAVSEPDQAVQRAGCDAGMVERRLREKDFAESLAPRARWSRASRASSVNPYLRTLGYECVLVARPKKPLKQSAAAPAGVDAPGEE